MLAFLQFYMAGEGMMWHEASLLAAKAAGKGKGLACTLRKWMWNYIEDRTNLPVNTYGRHKCSLLEDEDLAQELHEHRALP